MRESGPRKAVTVVVLTATRDNHIGRLMEYNGLLVYRDGDSTTSPTDRPILGWIIASIPRAVSGGRFMVLMFYKEGLNMAIIDKEMGEQMLELCHTAKVANRVANTVVKGFGFGDRVNKLLQQLVTTDHTT